MNYIISGPGRVGGHLLEGIIRSTGQTSVVRTHDYALDLGDDLNTVLIVADRRDRFAALMSNAIVRHTSQSTEYPITQIEPFLLDPGHFKHDFNLYIDYFKKHDLSRLYAGVYKLYFEDFVTNPQHVIDTLGLGPAKLKIPKLTNNPAPYNFENIIINWFELKTLYLRLRQGLDND